MSDQHGLPHWPTVIAMIGVGISVLGAQAYLGVRHLLRAWRGA